MEEIKRPEGATNLLKNAIAHVLSDEVQCPSSDLICLSHLRWDFVFQRPQHLMTRYARHRRVFFLEEPIHRPIEKARLDISRRQDGLHVVVPHLPEGTSHADGLELQKVLIDEMISTMGLQTYNLWYYTPMALAFTRHLKPGRIIYDCMDELSAFKGAPRELLDLEKELFGLVDHVFTGGHSLWEAKRNQHRSVHAFPSSIDFAHFSTARKGTPDPDDQKHIPHPRIGFFGVIDERADLDLVREVASQRPDWHFVFIGPVVKIDPATLPQAANIHYLGMKSYSELPLYLAHWDVAMLPFALNEATRFISPTKTPEYLAAGKPVISTAIRDVIRPYGEEGLVHIVSTPAEFIEATEIAMATQSRDADWLKRVDAFLAQISWDKTWSNMARLERQKRHAEQAPVYGKTATAFH